MSATRRPLRRIPTSAAVLAGTTLGAALGIMLITVPLGAQDVRSRDTSFAVSRNGVIDIGMNNGTLIVRGGNRGTAELRANGTNYRLRTSGVGVTLGMTDQGGRQRSRSGDRHVELLVPSGVKLVIHGMSTDVSIFDVAGEVDVEVLSGDVALTGLGARAFVSTLSGDIRVSGIAGDLRVSTVSGDIEARDVGGAVDVNTTSGDVELSAGRLDRVQFNSMSGSIAMNGALTDDARLQFTTHSGDVVLRLPGNAAGQIEFSTFNGDLRAGAVTLLPGGDAGNRRDGSARRYEFGGGGAARIIISTFNGDVTVVRSGRRGLN